MQINGFWFGLSMCVIASLLAVLVYLYHQVNNLKRQLDQAIHQRGYPLNESQLDVIESRLNPHLLKNILNSIQSHAYQTYYAMDKLANVLDYILYESRRKRVSPKDEIAFALSLIEINKIKLSPLFELSVRQKIQESEALYTQPLLAPMITIALIENAFKHADLQAEDAFIAIVFEFKDGVFSLRVSNKISEKQALRKEKSGIGIQTLDQRLKAIYNKHFSLLRFREGEVYMAQLKINLLEYEAEMHTTG